ncbi:peptide-methionine (S)-S-oxide reductase [Formosa sp. PL04]|uniref:peptide-methionine (S)-S-oxide reductase n=1 Tax=Formosa sp. PL04 TaxID=3081755 RepID=UPI0029824019|nr:peptide-methionine (S)-S-oxide reductase [Formosa sp. PL04]MDW5287987.1 peptide-methionine (S)-S-oxide reductase [Formosa sp. PL04]
MELKTENKIAFGGGCHWCTEAVFQSLNGVRLVEQGYIASTGDASTFSEAVIVHFNPLVISETVLLEIHLHTHKSTSMHSMRHAYRSAVYVFSEIQHKSLSNLLNGFQKDFNNCLITKVYSFHAFRASRDAIKNYYLNNPEKPFCERYIAPKLLFLLERYSIYLKQSIQTKSTL